MDFSGLILIPLSALTTAIWTIGAAVLSRKGPGFSPPFLLSYLLGVVFMQSWLVDSWQDVGMFVAMLMMLALWITAGCLVGGIPATLVVAVGTKLAQRLRR